MDSITCRRVGHDIKSPKSSIVGSFTYTNDKVFLVGPWPLAPHQRYIKYTVHNYQNFRAYKRYVTLLYLILTHELGTFIKKCRVLTNVLGGPTSTFKVQARAGA